MVLLACMLCGCSHTSQRAQTQAEQLRREIEMMRSAVASLPSMEADNKRLRARRDHLRHVLASLDKKKP